MQAEHTAVVRGRGKRAALKGETTRHPVVRDWVEIGRLVACVICLHVRVALQLDVHLKSQKEIYKG